MDVILVFLSGFLPRCLARLVWVMIFVLSEHGVMLIFYGFGQVIVLYRQFEIAFDVVFVSDGVYSLEHLFFVYCR